MMDKTETLRIDCLGDEWDGEYPFVVPTTRENRTFRIAAGIGPEEMTKISEAGSVEMGALIAYAAIHRAGKVTDEPFDELRRNTLIARLLDLPMDLLLEIVNSAATGDDEQAEGGDVIPPVSEPGDGPSPSEKPESDGEPSLLSSGT